MNNAQVRREFPGVHNSWRGMRARCRDTSRADAHCYALKGITVCEEWDSIEAFAEWALANGYRPGLTIERDDGAKGYSPENCRWVDRKVQARNISRNRHLEMGGVRHCLSEWAEVTGIPASSILARVDRLGWPVEKALTTPIGAIPTGPKPRSGR